MSEQNPTASTRPVVQQRRNPMHLSLIDRLREMIVDGSLVPGERINEVALSTALGVSRTPIREALKVLGAEGIVKQVQNRGTIVSKPSVQELVDDFQLLASLEGLAGELAAAKITEPELDAIRRLQRDMAEAFSRSDLPEYFRLNQAIHGAILSAARNPALTYAHKSVSLRVLASRFNANLSPNRWATALKEHQVILDLLELGHSKELSVVLKAHILRKLDAVLASKPDQTTAKTNQQGDEACEISYVR